MYCTYMYHPILSQWFTCICAGLEIVPDGVSEVLDIAGQNESLAFLRAKKKLEEYLPYEQQLVSCMYMVPGVKCYLD